MTNYTLPSTTISPYAPIENLAKPPRRSMSRVLSRCLSLNRKSISSGPSDIHSRSGPYVYSTTSTGTETEDQAIFRPSAQKAVRVDRDHEAIPRVASTHLARAQSQSGVAYKEIGKGGLTESQSKSYFCVAGEELSVVLIIRFCVEYEGAVSAHTPKFVSLLLSFSIRPDRLSGRPDATTTICADQTVPWADCQLPQSVRFQLDPVGLNSSTTSSTTPRSSPASTHILDIPDFHLLFRRYYS